MRRTIARDLQAGRTPDQIRNSFVRAYGAWILEAPPKRGLDLVAWVLPVLLLVGGLAGAALAVRRWSGRGRETPPSEGRFEGPGLSAADRALVERAMATTGEEAE
jgi:cytochrome c-type biogenesis protein CcmH